jgi:hypothetical protein
MLEIVNRNENKWKRYVSSVSKTRSSKKIMTAQLNVGVDDLPM